MELIESTASWFIALGKTLLNSLWLGLLVLSLLKALFLLIPQKYSRFRYTSSLLALLLYAALSAALFLYIYSPAESAAVLASGGRPLPAVLVTETNSHYSGGAILYQLVSLVYFSGMAIYLLISFPALGKIRRIRKDGGIISGLWLQTFHKLKADLGIKRKIEFLVSEQVSGPFITGVLKPALIVPAAMLSQLSFRESEAILLHELYHLKKLDHVVNLLQKLVEVLFFYNPSVWMISSIIRSEREKRCDDLVLGSPIRALDYARALYTLSWQENKLRSNVTAATGSRKGELIQRIERILKPNIMKSNYREKLNTLLIFTCGILLVLLISGFTSGFSIIQQKEEPLEIQNLTENPQALVSPAPVASPRAVVPPVYPTIQDTLTEKEKEKIRSEVKEAIEKAHAELDMDKILEDIEEARASAMEDIDWEQIKQEMEEVRLHIIEEIDWEQITKDVEEFRTEAMEEIDWEQAKRQLEEAKILAMEEINWEKIEKEMNEIDWEQMKIDMADFRIQIDSMLADFDFDMDLDFDFDTMQDADSDKDVEDEKR